MANCVNIKSKEFKELGEATGLSPLSLEVYVHTFQDMYQTDSFPTPEQIMMISDPVYMKVAKDLDYRAGLINTAMDTFNTGIVYFNSGNKNSVEAMVVEKQVREVISKVAFDQEVQVQYVNDRYDNFTSRYHDGVVYINLNRINPDNVHAEITEIVYAIAVAGNNPSQDFKAVIDEAVAVISEKHPELVNKVRKETEYTFSGPLVLRSSEGNIVAHTDELVGMPDAVIYKQGGSLFLFYDKDHLKEVLNGGTLEEAVIRGDENLVEITEETHTGKTMFENFEDGTTAMNFASLQKAVSENNLYKTIIINGLSELAKTDAVINTVHSKEFTDVLTKLRHNTKYPYTEIYENSDTQYDATNASEVFTAKDGSVFKTKSELDIYELSPSSLTVAERQKLVDTYMMSLDSNHIQYLLENNYFAKGLVSALQGKVGTTEADQVFDLYSMTKDSVETQSQVDRENIEKDLKSAKEQRESLERQIKEKKEALAKWEKEQQELKKKGKTPKKETVAEKAKGKEEVKGTTSSSNPPEEKQTPKYTIEVYEGNWTRAKVAKDPDRVYIFGDNTDDRLNTKHVPKSTQAVIRGLDNAIGIDTKHDRGKGKSSMLKDSDLEWFTSHFHEQIGKAIATGKPIVLPADGIGTGAANLAQNAPAIMSFINAQFEALKNGTYVGIAQPSSSDANIQAEIDIIENERTEIFRENYNKINEGKGNEVDYTYNDKQDQKLIDLANKSPEHRQAVLKHLEKQGRKNSNIYKSVEAGLTSLENKQPTPVKIDVDKLFKEDPAFVNEVYSILGLSKPNEDTISDIERRRERSLSKITTRTEIVLPTREKRIIDFRTLYFPKGYVDANDWQMAERIERETEQDLIEEINAKYDAEIAELNNEITSNDRVVFGHPTIGKSFLKNQGDDRFISLDDDYATEINEKVKEIAEKFGVTTYQVKDGGTQEWNAEYNTMMQSMFDTAKEKAIAENKTMFTSNTNLLRNNIDSFDKVINLTDAEFKKRINERGAKYDVKEWKSQINDAISKVPYNKVINTQGYLSDLIAESDVDQQSNEDYAKEIYKEYLENGGTHNDFRSFLDFVEFKKDNETTTNVDEDVPFQITSESSPEIIKGLNSYLIGLMKTLGINVEHINNMKERFGVNAIGATDLIHRVIYLAKEGEKQDTLPEEVAHMITSLMSNENSDLAYLLDNIESWSEYEKIKEQYMPIYKDENKVKMEAIGKLIAKSMLKVYDKGNAGYARESKETRSLLEKTWDILKKFFKNISKYFTVNKPTLDSTADNISKRILNGDIKNELNLEVKDGSVYFSFDPDIEAQLEAMGIDINSVSDGSTSETAFSTSDPQTGGMDLGLGTENLMGAFTGQQPATPVASAQPAQQSAIEVDIFKGDLMGDLADKGRKVSVDTKTPTKTETKKEVKKEAKKVVKEDLSHRATKEYLDKDKEIKALEMTLGLVKSQEAQLEQMTNPTSLDTKTKNIVEERLLHLYTAEVSKRARGTRSNVDKLMDSSFSEYRDTKYNRSAESEDVTKSKIEKIQNALNVKIIEDPDMVHRGALLASNHPLTKKFGVPVIVINPNLLLSDTVFHEFGHLYIEVLGGLNDSRIASAVNLLKKSDLYVEVSEAYPELKGEDLAKEVLATALGMEADKLFDRSLEDLTLWQKIVRAIKELLSGMFKKDPDYLTELANEVLNPESLKGKFANYKHTSLVTQYSKTYTLPKVEDNKSNNMQDLAMELFDAIREDLKTDFEDGKHDYYKDGEIVTSESISRTANRLSNSQQATRIGGNKGDYTVRFEANQFNPTNILNKLNEPVLPLALAKSLDMLVRGQLKIEKSINKPSNYNNWMDVYIHDIQTTLNPGATDMFLAQMSENASLLGENFEPLAMEEKIGFRQAIIENWDLISERAESIQGTYDKAPIVGNILHQAFEDIGTKKREDLPSFIDDEAGVGAEIKRILREGESRGSKFVFEQPIWDNINGRPGTADMIEITKDGKFRIYDFKTIKSLKNAKGSTKSDTALFVNKGYMHQTIAYGNILMNYGLQPASDAYNILMMEVDYTDFESEGDRIAVTGFINKSMETMKNDFNNVSNLVSREFKPAIDTSDITIKTEIENIHDAIDHIKDVMNFFNTRLRKHTSGVGTPNFDLILNDIKAFDKIDPETLKDKYNANVVKANKVTLQSFVKNVHDQLIALEDQKLNGDISKFIKGLNYVLQVAETLHRIEDIITSDNELLKLGMSATDKAALIRTVTDTINLIKSNRDYYKRKLKEISIYRLAENSALSEGRIKEQLELEASKKGIKDKAGIKDYIFKNLPQRKAEVLAMERAYWTSQYENGMLDLRTLEALMADPGMIKGQVVQVVKNIMDANDMSMRRQMMELGPEVEQWYNTIKSTNPGGGTKSQWGRFLNKREVFIPQLGKKELIEDGSLIPEFISDLALDTIEYRTALDNLMYEKKDLLEKPYSAETKARLEEINNEIAELGNEYGKKKKEGRKSLTYSEKRINPEFAKLSAQDQETLRFIHKKLKATDDLIEDTSQKLITELDNDVILYRLPYQRMGKYEALSNSQLGSQFKSSIQDMLRPPTDDTEYNLAEGELMIQKEEKLGTAVLDLQGNPLLSVPLWYRNKLDDPRLQSFDIPSLLLENHQTALTYKQGLELEADLFIIQESLNEVNGAKVNKVDGVSAEAIMDKTGLIKVKSESNNLHKVVRSSIENRLFKRPYMGQFTKGNYRLIKATEKLIKYSSLNSLSMNFKSAMATSGQGVIFRFIEGMVGEYFDMKDWKAGTSKTWVDFAEIVKDGQRHLPKSKTNLLLRHFGMEQNAQILVNKFVQDNFASKNLDTDTLYAVTSIAEKTVTSMLVYSLLNSIKVLDDNQNYLDKDGNITTDRDKAMTLDEAYTVENGVLKLHPKVSYTTHNLLQKYSENGVDYGKGGTEISSYLQDVYADLYGQYNEHMKSMAQRTIVGKMVMSMKGWLPRGLNRRFRGITTAIPVGSSGFLTYDEWRSDVNLDKRFYSQAKKQFQEGYYASLLRFVGSSFRENSAGAMGVIQGGKVVWDKLTLHEKANIKRAMIELGLMMSLTALTILMTAIAKGYDDKEDDAAKERIYLLAYMTYRINDELVTFVNPKSFMNMIQNPTASFNTLGSAFKLMNRIVGFEYDGESIDWSINDRYARGAKEDELKVVHDALKLFNPINNVKQFGSILGLDTGKTIEDAYKGQMLREKQ